MSKVTNPVKLTQTLSQLVDWSRNKYGDIPKRIKETQSTLGRLKQDIPNQDCINKIKHTETILDDLLKQEELWWAQRAKVHWLKEGDLNTKYFHHKASQRRRKNSIYKIADSDGNIWQDSHNIHSIF